MSQSNPYAYRYFLSLCRKTDAISILYTIFISRSLPVIFGDPPMIILSISSQHISRVSYGVSRYFLMLHINLSALCVVFSVSVSIKPIQISSGILPFILSSQASSITRDNSSVHLRFAYNPFLEDFNALSASSALCRIQSSRQALFFAPFPVYHREQSLQYLLPV